MKATRKTACTALSVVVIASCCWQPGAAMAQGTRSDYERARKLEERTRNKVFPSRVVPHWVEGESRFWYRIQVAPDAFRFVLVNAETGDRADAFDHDRLAAALSRETDKRIRPHELPFRSITFVRRDDTEVVEFVVDGKRWSCDLSTYDLSSIGIDSINETTVKVLPAVRRSGGSDQDTSVRFVNRTDGEVRIFWINLGRRVSYGSVAASKHRDQHTFVGHVWLVCDSDGEPLIAFEATAEHGVAIIDGNPDVRPETKKPADSPRRSAAVSPDGRWKARIRDHNVVLEDTESGRETTISSGGSADDPFVLRFHWSPDSTKLVAVQERVGQTHEVHLIESSPDDQVQPKLHSFNYRKPGDRIPQARPRLFDVANQREISVAEELYANPWSVTRIRWRPDSTGFTFVYNQRGHQFLRVLAVDGSTGEVDVIVDEQSETFIDYAGKQYLHHVDDTDELIWMSERDGWNHLYLYDARTGEVKNQITSGEWVVRGVDRVDHESRQAWFRAGGIRPEHDPYYVHFCRVNFDGTGLTLLTEGNGTHAISWSPDRRFFIDRWSRVDQPEVTELRRAADGTLVCELERADLSGLIEIGWTVPERFVAKGRDGKTDIHGIIWRPMNFDPERRYPVIEHIYAGPHSAFVPKRFMPYHRMFGPLAELGFIVVQIDGMGTSHRSKAFHDVCWKNLGDSGFPDRILWIKAAAKKYATMDISRVGIFGGSAGGQSSTRALLAHGDFYKVAVSDCGCHDNRMDKIWWNELWMGWPIGPHYAEQSNVTNAHKLAGKLMLVVGELDRNVDPASTMQVANALIKADKDFDLLVIPGAGHGAAESPYGKRRRRDFFVRHLLGAEPRVAP